MTEGTRVAAPGQPRLPDPVGHTENAAWIDADFETVWDITNDLEHWPELFSEYASVEVLDRWNDTVRFRLTMHPDAQGRVWSWVSERTIEQNSGQVFAHRVEPGPFEYMQIYWSYKQLGSGTELRWIQDFRMRPDAPVDTPAMTERINTNSTVQLARIKWKVEAVVGRGTGR